MQKTARENGLASHEIVLNGFHHVCICHMDDGIDDKGSNAQLRFALLHHALR